MGTGIPTHKTLAATPHTKAFSLIVPASEFQDTQRITAWELDASVAGPIKLQVHVTRAEKSPSFEVILSEL